MLPTYYGGHWEVLEEESLATVTVALEYEEISVSRHFSSDTSINQNERQSH